MANSQLRGMVFNIPEKIYLELTGIYNKYPDRKDTSGYKRLQFLLKNRSCTYEQMKRIKNFFDHFIPDQNNSVEYELNGGQNFRNWVERTLADARGEIKDRKTHHTNAGLTNQFRQHSDNNKLINAIKPPQVRAYPDIMTNSALMEQINKIKKIIYLID
jgi:hypothetical protein